MEATVQVVIKNVPGEDPTQLQSAVDEALTGADAEGMSHACLSAKVEDTEENTGNVGLEITVEDAAITKHFGEDDAEDNMDEDGVRQAVESMLETALNDIDDAEFEIEDISVE